MRHYCTLSDRNYLPKLVTMLESLKRHSPEPFEVHVLCMDMDALWLLYDLQLGEHVKLMSLADFEYAMNLSEIKNNRTWREYCWTCASNLMEYLMPWVGGVTYLDADVFFFSDPKVIFDEIGDKSLGITPHRFPLERRHMERNGRYNVGWVTAADTPAGRKCIARWAKNCRDWCYNRIEGKNACGDQRYLDDWETDFPGEVHSIQNIGANLAPWNVSQYQMNQGPTVDGNPVVFYHLHEFVDESKLTNYAIRTQDIAFIYAPYLADWKSVNERIAAAEIQRAEGMKAIEMQGQTA